MKHEQPKPTPDENITQAENRYRKARGERRLQKGLAAVWLGSAALFGYSALENHTESVRAAAHAEVFETQGNPEAASEWRAWADHKEDERNGDLPYAAMTLGLTVGAGGLAAAAGRRMQRAEIELEAAQAQQAQEQQQQPPAERPPGQ